MSVDEQTVAKIAKLARIKLEDQAQSQMVGELNAILDFIEQLSEVDTSGVEPMTSAVPATLKQRKDEVTSGGRAADIVVNAPVKEDEDHYFMVPKVVE